MREELLARIDKSREEFRTLKEKAMEKYEKAQAEENHFLEDRYFQLCAVYEHFYVADTSLWLEIWENGIEHIDLEEMDKLYPYS